MIWLLEQSAKSLQKVRRYDYPINPWVLAHWGTDLEATFHVSGILTHGYVNSSVDP
jgi:hypothetical protein